MFLSPPGSARLNDDSSEMFCNPNSNSSISMDDFVKKDDVWDNLDFRDLTNEATKFPVKPEFLSSSNRIHLHSPYNLQITCKIGFVNFDPYTEPQSPFNIMSRKAYNCIMKHELVYTGNNMGKMSFAHDGEFLDFSIGLFHFICLEAMLKGVSYSNSTLPLYFISLMYNRDIVQNKWRDGSRIIT
ncbi:hypothetical protein Tco_1107892 [Tanacetum coccineum]